MAVVLPTIGIIVIKILMAYDIKDQQTPLAEMPMGPRNRELDDAAIH